MAEDERQSAPLAPLKITYGAETVYVLQGYLFAFHLLILTQSRPVEISRAVPPSTRSDLIKIVQMDLRNKHRGGSTSTATTSTKPSYDLFTQQEGDINLKNKIYATDTDAIGAESETRTNSQLLERPTASVKTPSKESRLYQKGE